MQKTFSVRADWIWTGVGLPQANACITLQNNRILSVSTKSPPTAIDIGAYCILPGLINSHTHLEFSDVRQPVEAGNSFADWILRVVQHRQAAALVPSSTGNAPELEGRVESYGQGVRMVLDVVHARLGDAPPEPSRTRLLTNRTSSIESMACPKVVRFAELMGTTSRRAKQTWRAALALRKAESSRDVGFDRFGLSPHAPYTTTPRLIRHAVARCNRWQIPIMMHLAESIDEMRWLASGDGPLQELLAMLVGPDLLSTQHRLALSGYVHELCQAPLALIIHGNYLDESSMSILESHRDHTAVVYCPRTHAHFEHSIHPLRELRRRGISVLLGTDSRASNPDLSILAEARLVRRIFKELPASDILAMITTQPANRLGCAENIGYIRPGNQDRLTAVRCRTTFDAHVLDELLESDEMAQPLESILTKHFSIGS